MGDIEKNTASPLEGEGLRGDGVAKWYVVHTYSGHENKVKANILKMAENRGMTELIHDIVVPTEDVVEIKDGQKKIRTKIPAKPMQLFSGKPIKNWKNYSNILAKIFPGIMAELLSTIPVTWK